MVPRVPSVICIIPARGGSKGLPGKNIRILNGKPTIAWTIERALNSSLVTDVVVSTDSNEIARISKTYGADVPFLRPEIYATDSATTLTVVEHCLEYMTSELSRTYDFVLLAEPTSPLRYFDDFDKAIQKLIDNSEEYDSLVTLGPVRTHPELIKKLENKSVVPYINGKGSDSRRQDLDEAFFPYGVAYVVKTESLLEEKTFYTKRCLGHIVQESQCFEIDDIIDFICIDSIMKLGDFGF